MSEAPYKTYQDLCIELLNKLIMPCPPKLDENPPPKLPESSPKSPKLDENTPKLDEKTPKLDEKTPEPNESSTVLNHNGQVGSLEELIVFLIKSPIKDDAIRTKLNNVYKVFNPNARDIFKKTDPSAPPVPAAPVPPVPASATKSRDEQIAFFNKEYNDSKDKLDKSALIGKPFFEEGNSPKNILSEFEKSCMMVINDLTKINNDATIFTDYPELSKAKQEALVKIPDNSSYTDEKKKISLDYIENWKKIVDKIIEETKPKPSS